MIVSKIRFKGDIGSIEHPVPSGSEVTIGNKNEVDLKAIGHNGEGGAHQVTQVEMGNGSTAVTDVKDNPGTTNELGGPDFITFDVPVPNGGNNVNGGTPASSWGPQQTVTT